MPEGFLFKGARVVDPATGRDEVADVAVQDGLVASESAANATVLDCDGLVLAPGLVDLHTHLRQPGREDRETVETGTRAAALGGYTAVAAMANTEPPADSAAVIHEVRALAAERLAGSVQAQLDADDALRASLRDRELDPYAAAEELLRRIGRG